jgi:tRNA-2-methylthio-N6-dimethylallyladenosine synthase
MARALIPGLAVSTDIIVGFPGESDEEFDLTMEMIEESRFDQAFTFIFSPRPGTRAALMTDQFVPEDVIQERFERLVEAQNRISYELNQQIVGTKISVLSEGPSKKRSDVATTRSRTGKLVHVAGEYSAGTFLDVEIEEAAQHYLVGSCV